MRHKEIRLTGKHSDKVTKVSFEDYQALSQYQWHGHPRGYAHCWYPHSDGKTRKTLMHRVILGIIDKPHIVADHINGDPLDNRRENLRAVSQTDNQQNRKDRYKCVKYSEKLGAWISSPSIKRKAYLLGPYETKNEAISATANLRLEKVDNPAPADIESSNGKVLIKYVSDYQQEEKLQNEFGRMMEKILHKERRTRWQDAAKIQRNKDKGTRTKKIRKKSEHTGILWHYGQQKWRACYDPASELRVDLGLFETEEEATVARAHYKTEHLKNRKTRTKPTKKCPKCSEQRPKSTYATTDAGNLSSVCNVCSLEAQTKPKIRKCGACKDRFELTSKNFHAAKGGNLTNVCLGCRSAIENDLAKDLTGPKACNMCNVTYPRTAEYFYKRKESRDGFRSECKTCKIEKTLSDRA